MMKSNQLKLSILLLPLLAAIGLLITACSNDDEDKYTHDMNTFIQNVAPSKEVSDFFDREWPFLGNDGNPQNFFSDSWQDTCRVINTKLEFLELYHGGEKIPYIDFQTYSLVIGKIVFRTIIGENRPMKFREQKLYIVPDGYVLNLYFDYSIPEVSIYNDMFACFWGLYPKIDEKTVKIFTY